MHCIRPQLYEHHPVSDNPNKRVQVVIVGGGPVVVAFAVNLGLADRYYNSGS